MHGAWPVRRFETSPVCCGVQQHNYTTDNNCRGEHDVTLFPQAALRVHAFHTVAPNSLSDGSWSRAFCACLNGRCQLIGTTRCPSRASCSALPCKYERRIPHQTNAPQLRGAPTCRKSLKVVLLTASCCCWCLQPTHSCLLGRHTSLARAS